MDGKINHSKEKRTLFQWKQTSEEFYSAEKVINSILLIILKTHLQK
jgi:hypothetical protein